MGTDIHMVVEEWDGSAWRGIPRPSGLCPFDDNAFRAETHRWCSDRNYVLFAALADVRNGFGFAGCSIFEPLKPITRKRGFPKGFILDAEPEDEEAAEDFCAPQAHGVWMGDHSHTWCTLEDALSYDWDQLLTTTGTVNREQYAQWKATGRPKSWCGGAWGPGVETVPLATFEQTKDTDGRTYYTQVRWSQPLREKVAEFLRAVDWLKDHAKAKGIRPSDIRFVMGFDS